MPDITRYYSQWDSDNGGYKGLCAETCLKIAKYYYDGVEVPLTEIVANGDGDGTNTTEQGAIKAANYLNLNPKPTTTFWKDINQQDLKTWLGNGNLVVAFVMYNLIPAKYKQDSFTGLHAILLTAIVDDGSVRYCDPDFWGSRREEGWMNNNKWISWADLAPAWKAAYKPYMGLQLDRVKVTPPPVDPCATQNTKITELEATVKNRDTFIENLNREIADDRLTIRDLGGKLTDSEKEVEAKKAEIETLNTKLAGEVALRTQLAADNNDLTKKLTDQEDDFSRRMETAEKQIHEYKEKVEPLTNENTELKHKVDTLESQVKDLQVNTVKAVSSQVLLVELWNRLMRRG